MPSLPLQTLAALATHTLSKQYCWVSGTTNALPNNQHCGCKLTEALADYFMPWIKEYIMRIFVFCFHLSNWLSFCNRHNSKVDFLKNPTRSSKHSKQLILMPSLPLQTLAALAIHPLCKWYYRVSGTTNVLQNN